MSNRHVKLTDVCERIDYGLTASANDSSDGPRFLRITDIVNSPGDLSGVPGVEMSDADREKYRLCYGDIVVARTGASVGASYWLGRDDADVVFASYLVRFRIAPGVSSRYVSYVLRSSLWRDYVSSNAHSKSAQPNMSAKAMGEFAFDLPSFEMQGCVAAVLGALDDKIAANRNLAESCVHLQGAYWGSLTHNAPTTPLTTVAQPHLGGTPLRSDDSAWIGHVLWASVRDLTASSGRVVFSTAERISPEASLSAPRLNVLPAGTVVLTARGTVGEVAVLGVPAAINQSAYAFVPPEGMRVALRLSIEALRDSLRQHAHGSVFSTITMSTLAEAAIPDVFDDPSHHIITRLEHLEDRRIAALRENLRLAATRDELLPLLISGRITVKDAEKTVEEVV